MKSEHCDGIGVISFRSHGSAMKALVDPKVPPHSCLSKN